MDENLFFDTEIIDQPFLVIITPLPRLVGHPQFMIIRGNNRDPIFIANENYRFYLEKLKSDPID